MFIVLERGTNKSMGHRKTRKLADRLKEKLDLQYGSYHYYVFQGCEIEY